MSNLLWVPKPVNTPCLKSPQVKQDFWGPQVDKIHIVFEI